MAENVDLISEYINVSAVTGQTDLFLAQIKRLDDAYNNLSKKSVSLGGLSSSKEITAQIKELQSQLTALQKQKEQVINTDLKAAKIDAEKARANAIVTKSIIDQNKELDRQIAFEEKKASVTKKNPTTPADIPFTTNLAELEKEQAAANATGTAVNNLEKQQVEASLAANAWAKANGGTVTSLNQSTKATKLSSDELERNKKILIEEKLLQQQREKALKNQVASENSVKGSLEQRRLALIRLQGVYDKLAPSERDSASGKRLQGIISGVTTQIKTLEESTGRAQRNVGNYQNAVTGAFQKAFTGLRTIANILPGLGLSGVILLIAEPIIALGKSIAEAFSKVDEAKAKAQSFSDVLLKSGDSYTDNAIKLSSLTDRIKEKGKTDAETKSLIAEVNKEYENFGIHIKNANELETFAIKQAPLIITVLGLKAKATAALALATETAQKALKLQNQDAVDATTGGEQFVARVKTGFSSIQNFLSFFTTSSTNQYADYYKKLDEQRDKNVKKESDASQRFLEINEQLKRELAQFLSDNNLTDPDLTKNKGGSNEKLKAQQKTFNDTALKEQQDYYKTLSEIDILYLNNRIKDREKALDLEKQIINGGRNVEIENERAKLNAVLNEKSSSAVDIQNAETDYTSAIEKINITSNDKIVQAEKKKSADIIAIKISYAKRQAEVDRDNADLFVDNTGAKLSAQIKKIDDDNEKLLNKRKEARDIQIDAINAEQILIEESRNLTEKEETDFNDRRLQVERDFLNISLTENIKYYKLLVDLRKAAGQDVTALEAALQAARRAQSEADLKQNSDDDKKAIDAFKKKIDDFQRIANTAKSLVSIIGDGLSAGIIAQKNALQEQSDAIDKNKAKEIEAINATTLAASEKADKIAIINARADTQKQEIERKQRQLDQQRARFDKASTIANIIAETALAVVRALGSKPYTPANIALAALTGAIGAAQLAVAIAAPIPKYKYGTQYHPGGPAEVGHGKVEYALLPSGEGFATPSTPTQMFLPKGTKIYPDINDLPAQIMRMAMKPLRQIPVQIGKDNNEGVIRELKSLANVVRNKREFHTKTGFNGVMSIHKYGESWTKYVDENTTF